MAKAFAEAVLFLTFLGLLPMNGTGAGAEELYVKEFTYEIVKTEANPANYHLSSSGGDRTHIPHWIGDSGFTVPDAENKAKLNALNGVILFSDFPRAYNFGIATYNGAWAGSISTNITSISTRFLLSDGSIQSVNVPFKNTGNWKMYLEVVDKNGDYATFTGNNANGYISIPTNATASTRNTLKLAGGKVTDQMKLGLVDSSRSTATRLNGKYGISYNKGTVWDDAYLENLNQYTTYFAKDVEVEGVGKQTVVLKLDVVVDINCAGCLTYNVSDCMLANTYRIGIEKTSDNFNPAVNQNTAEFTLTGAVSDTAVISLDSSGAGSVSKMLYLDSSKEEYTCNVAEKPMDKVLSSPEDGYAIRLISRDIVKGVNDYKLWSASANGGEYTDYLTVDFSNVYPNQVYYRADENGAITGIEEETVKMNTAVSGSSYSPDDGYVLDCWTCTKDVALTDGVTIIAAGEPITDNQLKCAIAKETLTFTAHFMKKGKAGNLTVSKTVAGKSASPAKAFEFTITLSDPSVNGRFGDMSFTDGVAVFTLTGGQTSTATGLPAGTRYTVTEADYSAAGYVTEKSGDTGTIEDGQTAVAAFINTKIPKTGDDRRITLWFCLAGASVIGMACALLGDKRKKRQW